MVWYSLFFFVVVFTPCVFKLCPSCLCCFAFFVNDLISLSCSCQDSTSIDYLMFLNWVRPPPPTLKVSVVLFLPARTYLFSSSLHKISYDHDFARCLFVCQANRERAHFKYHYQKSWSDLMRDASLGWRQTMERASGITVKSSRCWNYTCRKGCVCVCFVLRLQEEANSTGYMSDFIQQACFHQAFFYNSKKDQKKCYSKCAIKT